MTCGLSRSHELETASHQWGAAFFFTGLQLTGEVMSGWIQLHRKLLENPVFKNPKLLQTFLYCLLKATHTEREQLVGDTIVKLQPGQLVTGRKSLAEATGLTEQKIRTALDKLKKLGILTSKPTTKYSVISITNWDSYQQTNQQVTNSQPTTNQQLTTNNNYNNYNNVNNDLKDRGKKAKRFSPPTHEEAGLYFLERGSQEAIQEAEKFIDFYESKGWLVGKAKMKDWKAAVRNWMKNNFGVSNETSKQIAYDKTFDITDTSWADGL